MPFAIYSLSIIMALRLIGLFMILPVFALYSGSIEGATPTLMGIALGIYGLTQGILQIPFGTLSDRIGRKPVITLGLLLFATGSALAALSSSITGIVIGRALQGAGAVGSVILATIADLTREENRSPAMAIVGVAIGFSFIIAMVVGPLLNTTLHLSGLFWLAFGFSLLGFCLLPSVPTPKRLQTPRQTNVQQISALIKKTGLWQLHIGIFVLHATLTALFMIFPRLLTHLHLQASLQTGTYLGVLLLAFAIAMPFIIICEKKRCLKAGFVGSITALLIAELLLSRTEVINSFPGLFITMTLFFSAFTWLEASLPSTLSKRVPIAQKGTAMGIYSTAQFLGIFVGGSLSGILLHQVGVAGLLGSCVTLTAVWLLIARKMPEPPYLTTTVLNLPSNWQTLPQSLLALEGVSEVIPSPEEGLLYIKSDKKIIEDTQLRNALNQGNLGYH